MEIIIDVLDVGDADAVVVHLKKDAGELVFLIDGGKTGHAAMVLEALHIALDSTGKAFPDFILCTHYDNDHIGGLRDVLSAFKGHPLQVWMHKTSEKIDVEKFRQEVNSTNSIDSIFPTESHSYLGGAMGADQRYYAQAVKTVEQEILLIKQLADLDMTCQEPLIENFKINGWPELSIVSPSVEFYQKQFPKKFDTAQLIDLAVQQLKADAEEAKIEDGGNANVFDALDAIKRTSITATNMNSAVLMLEVKDKKFLFAADAGIAAFNNMPSAKLENLHWLKVPHHGSINNINAELIKLMNPAHAVISGKKLIAQEVQACLAELGCKVSTTRDNGRVSFKESI